MARCIRNSMLGVFDLDRVLLVCAEEWLEDGWCDEGDRDGELETEWVRWSGAIMLSVP